MTDNQTGGSAFPLPFTHESTQTGMTLRDYFAAKAMQSIMASDRYMGVIGVNGYQHRTAEDSYAMADAMLKARKQ
jgi:hypothetical protein